MIEKGMGRTRLGRFAAITVPATIATAGLGFAMLQGMVGAALASSSSFVVKGSQTTGDSMELTANYVKTATSETNSSTSANSKDAMVSIRNGKVTNMCLAADTTVPVVGVLGLKIASTGTVNLGTGWTDLATDSLNGATAVLGSTRIGYAQSDLGHQSAMAAADNLGYQQGAFSMATGDATSTGTVNIGGLDAKVYALTLNGLSMSNLAISAVTGTVESGANGCA